MLKNIFEWMKQEEIHKKEEQGLPWLEQACLFYLTSHLDVLWDFCFQTSAVPEFFHLIMLFQLTSFTLYTEWYEELNKNPLE